MGTTEMGLLGGLADHQNGRWGRLEPGSGQPPAGRCPCLDMPRAPEGASSPLPAPSSILHLAWSPCPSLGHFHKCGRRHQGGSEEGSLGQKTTPWSSFL